MEFSARLMFCISSIFFFFWIGHATAFTQAQQQKIWSTEREALKRLRDEFYVEKPKRVSPCDWRGITCSGGHVIALKLSGLRRNRDRAVERLRNCSTSIICRPARIPPWLGSFSNLRILTLSRNNLSGPIPPELGKLSNLRSLDLSYNNFAGAFPEVVFKFSRLATLNLSGNHFSGRIPSGVGNLSGLRRFVIAGNLFEGEIPMELWSLTSITHLDISRNNISGPLSPQIGRLSKLLFLNVERNNITGSIPAEVSNCTMLQVLKMDHNSIHGSLTPPVGNLAALQTMFLSWNALSGSLPRELMELQSVKILDLAYNQFSGPLPENIQEMKSLLMVDLRGNFFNGSVPKKLPPIAKISRNCFSQAPHQHMQRSCDFFYRRIGLMPELIQFGGNKSGPKIEVSPISKKKGRPNLVPLLGGPVGGICLVLIVGMVVYSIQKNARRMIKPSMKRFSTREVTHEIGFRNRLGESFTYTQLLEATNKFDSTCLIKVGHSGDFYRGVLQRGDEVVVKRIDLDRVENDLYVKELEVFGKASHARLVPLVGHCLEMREEKFLVYKYMPNGNLESLLRKKMRQSSKGFLARHLDWVASLKIATGIAEGLVYLHHDCSPPIMHRDIKASSILLGDNFEVNLGSLSSAGSPDEDSQPGMVARLSAISHCSSRNQGDSGSSATTIANDVYCFGKLLIEIICGITDTIECNETHGESPRIEHVLSLIDIHDKDTIPRIVDPHLLIDDDKLEEIWAVAVIAKACLNPLPSKRPSMWHVLRALKNPLKVVRINMLNNVAARTSSHSSWNEVIGSGGCSSGSNRVIIPGTLREKYVLQEQGRS